jgi:hypothetical protein
MSEVVIGSRGADHLALVIDGSRSLGFWVAAHVQVGAFRGTVQSWTFTGTFRRLAQTFRTLQRTLKGSVGLHLEEGVLDVEFVGDGKGHIKVIGELRSNTLEPRASIKFEFTIDQTYLDAAIRAIDDAEPPEQR